MRSTGFTIRKIKRYFARPGSTVAMMALATLAATTGILAAGPATAENEPATFVDGFVDSIGAPEEMWEEESAATRTADPATSQTTGYTGHTVSKPMLLPAEIENSTLNRNFIVIRTVVDA